MFDKLLAYCQNIQHEFLQYYPLFIYWMLVFWIIYIINNLFLKGRLNALGILPRRKTGLIGIVLSPFLHGNLSHLFVNSLMLIILGFFVLILNPTYFYPVSAFIIVVEGLLTWTAGRPYLHIGASGLVMGYWGYLMVYAFKHPSHLAIVIVAICIYYFSAMFMNLFPSDKEVSWEAHVFGFAAGIGAVYCIPTIIAWL